jgi:Histidine kinase-, DNA gyrase B-, and HSP90-like ATPase
MPRKIKVHEKALAHLSRGLYRSPASALRELVSNAWDADATAVHISTNYPNFLQLTIQDNGTGFAKDDFQRLMEGGIGNSDKRRDPEPLINKRPVIGRLGIGLLGIAQLTGGFTVISKTDATTGFRAKVRLYDLLKEKLDREDNTVVTEVERVKEVDLGTYDFEAFDPATARRGTTILADDIHPMFARSFQESLKFDKFKVPPLKWADCLPILAGVHSLQELGDYWRLLWELAASCPVPYLSAQAIPDNLVKKDNERLLSYDFAVAVDGRKLFKPVRLEGHPEGYTTFRIPEETRTVYGREVKFHGYLAVQEGRQLQPDELRGVLIRIKNVAIGYYDPSMLDYRTNEGPRSRWLTGEVYIDEGLEDALNVDRDSFNRVHPEFKVIQTALHDALKKVFSDVWRNIDVRSDHRAKARERTRKKQLETIISDAVESQVVIRTGAAMSLKGRCLKSRSARASWR